MPIPALFLGLAGAQLLEGGLSALAGKSDLAKLHKQKFPEYAETPEQRNSRLRAEEMSQRGFTAQETAARQAQITRGQNTGYQKAMNVAPNLAQATLAGIGYANVGAQNQFAGQDAALHRQNIAYADKFSQQLQNLSNMNIAAQQRNRIMAEQSIGRGIADSRDRMMGVGNTLIAGYAYDQMGRYNDPLMGLKTKEAAPKIVYPRALGANQIPAEGAGVAAPSTTDWMGTGGYNIPALAGIGKLFGAPAANAAVDESATDWYNTGGYR